MDNSFPLYALRAEGKIHSEDTRFVSCCGDFNILTSSRDSTACVSLMATNEDEILSEKHFIGHQAFVNFILFHPHLPLLNNSECFITGSNDNHVLIWSATSCELEAVVDGHAKGVACGTLLWNVAGSSETSAWDGDILTGDWNGSCIIFSCTSGKAKQIYNKHGVAIRGVTQLPETALVVSGSGDKTAHVWNLCSGETVQICKYHVDVVQCVCAISSDTFATGSNDCIIALWKVGSDAPLRKLEGHSSLVYGLSYNKCANQLLSCSEDRSVIIWADPTAQNDFEKFETRQVVAHPTLVWSVCALPCGDFLTGSSDGYVRAFTQNVERYASLEKIQEFSDKVASQKIDARTGPAELVSENLPSVNDLNKYLGKEGQKKMFRNNNSEVELYIMTNGKWDKVGIVVSGPDQKPITGAQIPMEKKVFNGKQYDYLFDVDANGKVLQLPYNRGECVISVARKFINENPASMSMNHFEEIRDFIIKNISEEDRKQIGSTVPTQKVEIVPFTIFQIFSTFNATGAQKKVDSLLGASNAFLDVMEAVKNGENCTIRLLQLCHELPQGSRFPAIDALRFSLCKKDIKSDSIIFLCENFFQSGELFRGLSNSDTTVIIHLLATILELITSEQNIHLQSKVILTMLTFVEQNEIFSAKSCKATPQIEKAVIAFLTNSSLCIINSLPIDGSPIEQLDMFATFLLIFCMSAFSQLEYPILAVLLTLYNSPGKLFSRKLVNAFSIGKDFLPQLKTNALNAEDSEIRRVCVLLLEMM